MTCIFKNITEIGDERISLRCDDYEDDDNDDEKNNKNNVVSVLQILARYPSSHVSIASLLRAVFSRDNNARFDDSSLSYHKSFCLKNLDFYSSFCNRFFVTNCSVLHTVSTTAD